MGLELIQFLIFDFESCFYFNLYAFTTNPVPLLEMRRLFHHWLVCAETYRSPLVAGSLIGHNLLSVLANIVDAAGGLSFALLNMTSSVLRRCWRVSGRPPVRGGVSAGPSYATSYWPWPSSDSQSNGARRVALLARGEVIIHFLLFLSVFYYCCNILLSGSSFD